MGVQTTLALFWWGGLKLPGARGCQLLTVPPAQALTH